MPLKPGAKPEDTIPELIRNGKPKKQAVAIALSNSRRKPKALVTATGNPIAGPTMRKDTVMPPSGEKATPASVKYTKQSTNPATVCAKCKYFFKNGTCAKVSGQISPEGWCKLFEPGSGVKMYQSPRPFSILELGRRLKAGMRIQRGTDNLRYMFIITSNSYKDREDEAMTTKALKRYVDQSWKEAEFVAEQPYYFWHDDTLPKLGDIIWADMNGPFLTEVAREADNAFAKKVWDYIEKNPKGWGTSHGFNYPVAKQRKGIYHEIEKFETSLLPLWAAANPYTLSTVISGEKNMGSSETRDSVLDRILGKKGKSAQYRKATDSLARALDEQGIKHKGLNFADVEVDDELLEDIQLVVAMHKAKKKPPFMMENEPDGDEAEEEKEYDDMGEEVKGQPGYGEMDDSEPEQTPAMVSTAITKRPGSFPPPVSHQQRTGKSVQQKPAPRRQSDENAPITATQFKEVMQELLGEFDKFKSDHESEMREVVEFMDAVKSNMAFSPRQASAAPETQEQNPALIAQIKAMSERPIEKDPFWNTN